MTEAQTSLLILAVAPLIAWMFISPCGFFVSRMLNDDIIQHKILRKNVKSITESITIKKAFWTYFTLCLVSMVLYVLVYKIHLSNTPPEGLTTLISTSAVIGYFLFVSMKTRNDLAFLANEIEWAVNLERTTRLVRGYITHIYKNDDDLITFVVCVILPEKETLTMTLPGSKYGSTPLGQGRWFFIYTDQCGTIILRHVVTPD